MTISSTNKLIAAFIMLILGVVFASQVATIGQEVTTKSTVINESIDITDAKQELGDINVSVTFPIAQDPTDTWKALDCPITSVTYGNSSKVWALTTDYTFDAATGVLTLVNSTDVRGPAGAPGINSNDTVISYIYCGDDYINLTWGRTGINLVPGFFAIALLLISVGLFYSIAKENGIIS